ncbi:MAG: tetratricopeptide repeat protein [Candidatus Latescibacterota bacterium]
MVGEHSKLTKEELKEDEFVERVGQAIEFVRSHVQLVLGAVAALVVLVLGVDYLIRSQEKARLEAAAELGRAMMAEDAGQRSEAVRILSDQVLGRYEGTPAAGKATLMLANRRFSEGAYAEARTLYQKCLDDYGDNPVLAYGAWSGLAACLEAEGKVPEAARQYQDYADRHPGTGQAALALSEAARCYGQLGDREAQKGVLQRLARDYPRLPLARTAEAAIKAL